MAPALVFSSAARENPLRFLPYPHPACATRSIGARGGAVPSPPPPLLHKTL